MILIKKLINILIVNILINWSIIKFIMKYFKYCLCDYGEKTLLEKHIVTKKNHLYLQTGINKSRIVVKLHEFGHHKFMEIQFADTIEFMKFLFHNNHLLELCERDTNHVCCFYEYLTTYFNHIFSHNILDHIKCFMKTLGQYLYKPEKYKESIKKFDIIRMVNEFSDTDAIKIVFNYIPCLSVTKFLIENLKKPNLDVIFYILKQYKKYIRKCIRNDLEIENIVCLTPIIQHAISLNCNVDIIATIIEEFENLVEMIMKLCRNNPNDHLRNVINKYQIDQDNKNILFCQALKRESIEIAKYLLQNGATINSVDAYTINDLIQNDDYDSLEFILQEFRNSNININGIIDIIFQWSYRKSIDVIDFLIEYGADYKTYGPNFIYKARIIGNEELANYLEELLNDRESD